MAHPRIRVGHFPCRIWLAIADYFGSHPFHSSLCCAENQKHLERRHHSCGHQRAELYRHCNGMDLAAHQKLKNPASFQPAGFLFIWLPDQGSNLDSSDPESDVLPITPSGIAAAKLISFIEMIK